MSPLMTRNREAPRQNFYVETRNVVPLQSEFKPAMKVLSRKPAPTVIARKDPVTGIEKLKIQDDEDDEEETKPKALTMEERQAKAQKDREEKQRKYEEARERLFGTSSASAPSSNSHNRATPSPSRVPADRSRGRGRGSSRPTSASGQKSRQLYDPTYSPKPDSSRGHRQENIRPISPSKAIEQEQVLRQPRGPDGSGRGGHGFGRAGKRP